MSKNYRKAVIEAIKKAGYEFSHTAKHGDVYKKDGKKDALVPRRIHTTKIANNSIHRAERNEP